MSATSTSDHETLRPPQAQEAEAQEMMQPVEIPDGDYVVSYGADTEDNRRDAEQTLRNNGCRRFRADVLEDGRMIVHGYLRAA